MDADNEIARAKWLLFSGLLFVVSCFICYDELVYVLKGRETQATVTKAYEVTRRGRFGLSRGTRLTVEYAFTEPDGTRRSDSDTVDPDWDLPSTGTVRVRYTPGASGRSRLAGHVNWGGIGIFVVSLGVMGYFGFRLWREAAEAMRPRKSKRVR
jgi:hypothetical protein